MEIYAIGLLACAVVGAYIGQTAKARPVAGAVLGLLLGPIGWAVVFVIAGAPRCPACMSHIHRLARKCPKCGESLTPQLNWEEKLPPKVRWGIIAGLLAIGAAAMLYGWLVGPVVEIEPF
jgi:hypothetical protein